MKNKVYRKLMAACMVMALSASVLAGCGGGDEAADTKAEVEADEGAEEDYVEEDYAEEDYAEEDYAEEDADAVSDETLDVSAVMSMYPAWADDSGNVYVFAEDYTYSGYDPSSGAEIEGVYNLMTEDSLAEENLYVLTLTDDADNMSQFLIEAVDEGLILYDIEDMETVVAALAPFEETAEEEYAEEEYVEEEYAAESEEETLDVTALMTAYPAWVDDASNVYVFTEDYRYSGYDPYSGEEIEGNYSLVTDEEYAAEGYYLLTIGTDSDPDNPSQFWLEDGDEAVLMYALDNVEEPLAALVPLEE